MCEVPQGFGDLLSIVVEAGNRRSDELIARSNGRRCFEEAVQGELERLGDLSAEQSRIEEELRQELLQRSSSPGRRVQSALAPGTPLDAQQAFVRANTFSYDPPIIDAIVSNTPDARGESIEIRGINFGQTETPVSIFVGGRECMNAEWQNDRRLRCYAEEDFVGPKNFTLMVAN